MFSSAQPSLLRSVEESRETYRGDLPGQIDILGQLHLALLQWTLKISLSNRVAAVCLLVDERDETVFDLEMHHEAFTDFFLEVACSGDGKFLAPGFPCK